MKLDFPFNLTSLDLIFHGNGNVVLFIYKDISKTFENRAEKREEINQNHGDFHSDELDAEPVEESVVKKQRDKSGM